MLETDYTKKYIKCKVNIEYSDDDKEILKHTDLEYEIPSDFNEGNSGNMKFLYTLPKNQGNHEETFLSLIDLAIKKKEAIFLSSFILNYPKIIDKLVEASNLLKGKIYVLTTFEKNVIRNNVHSSEIEKLHDISLNKLIQVGIRVRGFSNSHWKVMIIGNIKAIVSTANITMPAFTMNPEIGVEIITSPHINFLKEWFLDIWKYHATEELRDNTRYKLNFKNHNCPSQFYGSSLKIWNKFNDNHGLESELVKLIKSAKKSIRIMVYSLNNKKILKALKEVSRNGIKIQIILPETANINLIKHKYEDVNAEIKYYLRNHAKIIIIDEIKSILLTGNLDRFLHENDNIDLAVFSKSKSFIKKSILFFDLIFSKSKINQITYSEGKWLNFREINLLVQSPTVIYKNKRIDIVTLIQSLRGSLLKFYDNSIDNSLILEYRVLKGKTEYIALKYFDNGYKFQDDKGNRSYFDIVKDLTPTYYRQTQFSFIWLDIIKK